MKRLESSSCFGRQNSASCHDTSSLRISSGEEYLFRGENWWCKLKSRSYTDIESVDPHSNVSTQDVPALIHPRDVAKIFCPKHSGCDDSDLSSRTSYKTYYMRPKKLYSKRSKLNKAKRKSALSIIREGGIEYSSGDYCRGMGYPPMEEPRTLQRTNKMATEKRTQQQTRGRFVANNPPLIKVKSPGAGGDSEVNNRKNVSLGAMGMGKTGIKIGDVQIPPKKDILDALYERISTFMNPDISVIVESVEFSCHRIVLECYSEYFEELPYQPEVVIDGVTENAFVAIYHWILAAENEGFRFIKKENILEVLIASKILKIKELENQCLALIDSKDAFTEDNAFFLFVDASRKQQPQIMELMIPRIQMFFLLLVSSTDFLELELEDLCTLLVSNYIVVHCEFEIFMAAVKWLMARKEEREEFIGTVMKCIRFGLMTPAQLVDIRKNPVSPEFLEITKDKSIQIVIEDGLAYAVEKAITGHSNRHSERCDLLKLKIPEERNWTKNIKVMMTAVIAAPYFFLIFLIPRSYYWP